MARTMTYTQAQLDEAKQKLAELPDLSKDKISKVDFLESIKEQIVTLSSSKGYTHAEIKSALETVGVTVTVKAIGELLNAPSKRGKSKKA